MNLYALLGVGLVISGGLYYSHKMAYEAGVNAQIAEQKSSDDLIAKVRDEAMLGAADAISKITIKNTTIMGRLQKEIQTNTVYRDCEHTDDGLRLVNEALTNARRPDAAASGQLPAASAAHR